MSKPTEPDAVETWKDVDVDEFMNELRREEPDTCTVPGDAAGLAHREGWRYVEDWLPEDAGWYLVTAIEQFEDARTTTSFFVNGYWNRKVIAWMPLPEPAKLTATTSHKPHSTKLRRF